MKNVLTKVKSQYAKSNMSEFHKRNVRYKNNSRKIKPKYDNKYEDMIYRILKNRGS